MEAEQISERDAQALDSVSDRYVVRSILGRGAFASVYLADDLRGGRPVVIKLLSAGADPDSDAGLARFRAEVAATRKFEHRNVVRVLDDGLTTDHRPYLVTEFTAGRSLAAVLRESGRLTTSRAVEVGIAISEALAYVHSKGFVHRDLKPSNVLIPGWPEAPDFRNSKLLDFGVAGRLEQGGRTQAGMIYGTLRYMSPEQIKGEQQSTATDVYGFGLLLFEMLAGSAPAKREQDLTTLLIAIRDGISERDLKNLEPDLADLIRRCVRTDPAERPAIAVVLEELKHSPHRIPNDSAEGAMKIAFDLPASAASIPVPPRAAAPAPATSAQKLTERTLMLDEDRPSRVPSHAAASAHPALGAGSRSRRWLLWTAVAAIAAAFAIVAILYFRPATPTPHPAPNDSKLAPEKPTIPPSVPGPVSTGTNETAIRAIRFAAGLLLMVASIAIAFGLRRWLGGRSDVKAQAYELVFGARARTDLTATIALQLQDLVSNLRKLDQRILAGTVALMLEEYGSATDTKDRQAALMNVVALSEKLAVRLSPWYERYKEIIASAVAVMGGVSGLMTAINSVLSHKH